MRGRRGPPRRERLDFGRGTDGHLGVMLTASRAVMAAFRHELDAGNRLRAPQFAALRLLEASLVPFEIEDPAPCTGPDASMPPGGGVAHLGSGAGEKLPSSRPAALQGDRPAA
jgi:hypothetical protein